MSPPRLAVLAVLGCLLLAPAARAAVYVTDQLEITLRSGPTLENRILKMLVSGTSLETLEEREGWTRVRTGGGDEGWVLARYLTNEPPKGPRLEAAVQQLERLKTETAGLKGELEATRKDRDRLAGESRQLQARLDAVEKEYAAWKKANENVVSLQEQATNLEAEHKASRTELERLQAENKSLKARETFYWFFSGVVVLLLGWALGFFYSSSRAKMKSQGRLRF